MPESTVWTPELPSVDAEPERPSLRRNFSWTLAGNLTYAGCQWGMLVEIAKLGRPEMVGHFALALAIGAPIIMLTNLQLRSVQATDFAGQYRFASYFRLRLFLTTLALAAIAVTAFAGKYDRETTEVILLVGLAKAFEAMSDIYYGRLQQLEQMDRISISLGIKGVLVAGRAGNRPAAHREPARRFRRTRPRLAGRPAPLRLGAAPRLATLRSRRRLPGILWRLIRFSAPLGISMMLISLNTNIPRYFVQHYLGAHDLGIFAALSYLVVAGSTVTNALGQAATPRLAAAFATDRAQFYVLLRKMLLVGIALGAAGILGSLLFGRVALRLIYRPEYALHNDVFVLLMLAAAISYVFSFLGYAGTATRVFDRLLVPYSIVTAVAFLSGFLVKPFGLNGAALSLFVTYLASCAVPLWILRCAERDIPRPVVEQEAIA